MDLKEIDINHVVRAAIYSRIREGDAIIPVLINDRPVIINSKDPHILMLVVKNIETENEKIYLDYSKGITSNYLHDKNIPVNKLTEYIINAAGMNEEVIPAAIKDAGLDKSTSITNLYFIFDLGQTKIGALNIITDVYSKIHDIVVDINELSVNDKDEMIKYCIKYQSEIDALAYICSASRSLVNLHRRVRYTQVCCLFFSENSYCKELLRKLPDIHRREYMHKFESNSQARVLDLDTLTSSDARTLEISFYNMGLVFIQEDFGAGNSFTQIEKLPQPKNSFFACSMFNDFLFRPLMRNKQNSVYFDKYAKSSEHDFRTYKLDKDGEFTFAQVLEEK